MNTFIRNNISKIKWSSVALLCVIAVLFQIIIWDQTGYAQSWGGSMFRTASGGFMGWVFSRFIIDLDLSKINAELQPLAAISQALIVGFFAHSVGTG